MTRKAFNNAARLALVALVVAGGVAAIIGSGGGGGGDGDDGGPVSVPTTVSYTIRAPQTSLGQTEMTLALGGNNTLTFKKGPDGSTELPKTSGTFDILSGAMTAYTESKLWLDLPQAVASAKVSVSVSEKLEWYLGDEPSAGALTITLRSGDISGLAGTIRLRFKVDCEGTVQPFRVEWDSNNDGTFEQHACYSADAFPDLWSGAGAPLYARVASGAYLGWSSLYTGFQFTLEAMRRIENSYDDIAQLPPGAANPVTVSCNLYPPAQAAGSYGLNWHDWNISGTFNAGDMVRMTAGDCWINNPGDPEDPRINGTLELRSYVRNQGAAPTFVGMSLTLTLENPPGTFTDQGTVVLNGGFTLVAPGIVPSATSGPIGAFNFTNGNMLAAARIAASSAAFFPPTSQVMLAVVERLRTGGTPPFNLNICQNSPNGTATLLWADLGSPGLSAGDSASLGLGNCDLDGTLTTGHIVYDFTGVTPISASADVTLQGLTTISTTKSGGFSGKMSVEVIVNAGTRTVEHKPGAANGVITATVSGQNAWQLGCFDVIYGDSGSGTAYTLINPSVLKASNKIMSIAGGSSLFLQFQLGTPDVLNFGGFTLLSISLPECAALGVPNGVGDSDGNYVTVRGNSPNDNVDDLLMTLYNNSSTVLGTAPTSWRALVE